MEKYGRSRHPTCDNIVRLMRFTCWVTKAQSTHSEFAIHIDFLRQELLEKHASVLRYTYNTCLFFFQS